MIMAEGTFVSSLKNKEKTLRNPRKNVKLSKKIIMYMKQTEIWYDFETLC